MSSIFGAAKDDQKVVQKEAVRESAINTVTTGIPGFDESLGQGLPAGNLYLLSGQLGSNANLFAQQILYHTIIKKGKVTYYTVESASTDIIQDMALFDMKIQEYVDDGSWVFARVLPANMKKITEALPEAPMEKRIDLVDSLSSLMNSFLESAKEGRNTALHLSHLIRNFSLEEIQNLLFFMTGAARKYGGVHFILMTEGSHEHTLVVAIKDAVDSVFDITAEVRGSEIENTVTIQKIRNMMPKARVVRLAVKNNGMVTETIRRIQ